MYLTYEQDQVSYYQSQFLYFPINFQSTVLNYYYFFYDSNAVITIKNNPSKDLINNSTKVAQFQFDSIS